MTRVWRRWGQHVDTSAVGGSTEIINKYVADSEVGRTHHHPQKQLTSQAIYLLHYNANNNKISGNLIMQYLFSSWHCHMAVVNTNVKSLQRLLSSSSDALYVLKKIILRSSSYKGSSSSSGRSCWRGSGICTRTRICISLSCT